ncbi:MAG: GAF domain-containing protein, partial [Omnitrophica bacterium]|nr:GAF domain-containing protein [Candidatus Omnitrophota bacterium]
MTLFSLSGLAILITSLVLVFILLIYGKTRLHKVWTLFNLVLFIWGFGIFLLGNATDDLLVQRIWRLIHIGGLSISVFFYHTVCRFCELNRKKILLFAYFQLLFFQFLNITGVLFSHTQVIYGIYFPRIHGLLYPVGFAIWLIFVFLGHFELFLYLRGIKGIKRIQGLYFFSGSLLGFLGGSSSLLPVFGISIVYPFGNFAIPFYTIITTYAILKYRLMDIRVFISRAVAFVLCYPIFLGIPFVIAYNTRPYLFFMMGIHWWLVPSIILVVIASVAPFIYNKIKQGMDEALLAEQKRYQKLLKQAAGGMVTEHDLARLSKLVVYIVKRTVKLSFAAIFLDDKKEGVYRLKAIRDSGHDLYRNVSFLYEYPFIEYIRNHKSPVLFEELPQRMRDSLTIPAQISLIVPIFTDDYLIGFVFLGEKLNRQAYSEDDISVFKILSNQTALAIENCLFMEESKKTQERIFAAEKLASIGGMADGVAHQIKNRLNQFSIASGELKYEVEALSDKHAGYIGKNPDFKKSLGYLITIAESLIKNVKRTDAIIKGILQFARVEEKETFFSHFSLKECIDLSTELLKIKHSINKIPLKVQLDSPDTIYGVKSQMTEAIYNLLDNAFEATQEKKDKLSQDGKTGYSPL